LFRLHGAIHSATLQLRGVAHSRGPWRSAAYSARTPRGRTGTASLRTVTLNSGSGAGSLSSSACSTGTSARSVSCSLFTTPPIPIPGCTARARGLRATPMGRSRFPFPSPYTCGEREPELKPLIEVIHPALMICHGGTWRSEASRRARSPRSRRPPPGAPRPSARPARRSSGRSRTPSPLRSVPAGMARPSCILPRLRDRPLPEGRDREEDPAVQREPAAARVVASSARL
jgi:hypothetical protein